MCEACERQLTDEQKAAIAERANRPVKVRNKWGFDYRRPVDAETVQLVDMDEKIRVAADDQVNRRMTVLYTHHEHLYWHVDDQIMWDSNKKVWLTTTPLWDLLHCGDGHTCSVELECPW